MGTQRNGARSFLDAMAACCKWSRMPGFRAGVISILGPEAATEILGLWDPLCAAIDVLIGLDNWYNQKDATNDDASGEDSSAIFPSVVAEGRQFERV